MERMTSRLLQFLADNGVTVQAIIDRANERFAPVWYPRFFRVLPPTVNLDFTTIIGRTRVEAMASIVSRESEFPLRGRPGLEKLKGEVPTIAVMRKMTAQEFRDLEILRRTPGLTDQQVLNAIIDSVFDDYLYCTNAVNKRLDAMCIQAVSSAKITIDAANNPDGIAFDVPLLLDPTHLLRPVKVWTDPTADIIVDIENALLTAQDHGKGIDRIMVSRTLWRTISKNSSVREYVKAYNNPGSNNKIAVTLDGINEALRENLLPPFEIVDELTAVETDGLLSPFRAWDQQNAVFVPAGQLGVIHNALADEQITPIPEVQYANAGNILLSRWYNRKPVSEFTSGEWNAFPGLERIDSMYIMETDVAAV